MQSTNYTKTDTFLLYNPVQDRKRKKVKKVKRKLSI